jgi:ActR/RegA family two-component response regulator
MATVLILEGDYIQATDLTDAMEAAGHRVLGPAPSMKRAFELARATPPDAALIDLNVKGEDAGPMISELEERKIPLVIITGYGEAVDGRFAPHLVLHKPLKSADAVAVALASLPDGKSTGAA